MAYRKTLLTALILGAALMICAGTAFARRLEFSNQTFRAVYPGGASTEEFNVNCPTTLEGSFHSRTLSKVCGQLVGYVTRATVAEAQCNGGRMRFQNERLPWHIRYHSFNGTLPNIASMTFLVVGWGINFIYAIAPNFVCLYLTTEVSPEHIILTRELGGAIEPLTYDELFSISKFEGSEICPAGIVLKGQATYRILGSTTTKVTVRLVQ
jgi:hypothetical protein